MDSKQFIRLIQRCFDILAKLIFYGSALSTFIGIILKIFRWGKSGPFAFFVNNIELFWIASLTAGMIVLWLLLSGIHRRFVRGFSDNFRGNLHDNWDFVGPWRTVGKNILIVTGSDEGGITKVGSLWENYTFTFEAKIINECLGIIVRAQDFYNYYMFQIRADKIRPHRRVTVPVITDESKTTKQSIQLQPQPRPILFLLGWQHEDNNPEFNSVPINPNLSDWFDVKVIVQGQSIQIYIDGNLILHRPSFLQIPIGKIGFRNFGSEEAQIKNVRVVLQS